MSLGCSSSLQGEWSFVRLCKLRSSFITTVLLIRALTCRTRHCMTLSLHTANMRSHCSCVCFSFWGELNESRFKSAGDLFVKFCKSGCRKWSFTSPIQQSKISSSLQFSIQLSYHSFNLNFDWLLTSRSLYWNLSFVLFIPSSPFHSFHVNY